jgi:hypothetical protein
MITFDLHCSLGHGFEGWFSSSTDYDAQQLKGLLRCPYCDDAHVEKSLSAPNIGRKGNQAPSRKNESEHVPADAAVGEQVGGKMTIVPSTNVASANMTPAPQELAAMMVKLAEIQKEVLKDSQWVGRKFADEARAIHYGETENRQIHGETSPKEAEALVEEGISIAALPLPIVPPEAKN